MHSDALRKRNTTKGLLEQSDSKYDIGPFRVGPFQFTVNYQHPPIDRRTRILTTCIVAGSMVFAFLAITGVKAWTMRAHPFISIAMSGFIHLALLGSPVAALFLWWHLGGRRREEQRLSELIALQTFDEQPSRISVRGRPTELMQFASIRDEFFEPQLFHTSHRMINMRIEYRVLIAGFVCIFFILFLFLSGLGHQRWWLVTLIVSSTWYLVLRGIPDAPTYYRFVPGRLDRLRFPWILRRKPEVLNLDLRHAKIRIDLASRRKMVEIKAAGWPLVLRRDNIPSPLNFSVTLARTALSTATPPPLPMDALTG